jgi:hypothetical protein
MCTQSSHQPARPRHYCGPEILVRATTSRTLSEALSLGFVVSVSIASSLEVPIPMSNSTGCLIDVRHPKCDDAYRYLLRVPSHSAKAAQIDSHVYARAISMVHCP